MQQTTQQTGFVFGKRARSRRVLTSLGLSALLAIPATLVSVTWRAPRADAAPLDSVCPAVGVAQPVDYPFSSTPVPATSTSIDSPWDVAVDTDGSVYFVAGGQGAVHRVAPNGTMTIVAGNGQNIAPVSGSQALSTTLDSPTRLAIDRTRRRLYIGGSTGVHRLDLTTGVITHAAGNGSPGVPNYTANSNATSFTATNGFDVAANGDLIVAVPVRPIGEPEGTDVLRIVDGTGAMTRVAGTGTGTSFSLSGPTATTPLPFSVDVTEHSNAIFLLTDNTLIVIDGPVVTRLNADPPGGTEADGPLAGQRLFRNNSMAIDRVNNLLFIASGFSGTSVIGNKIRRVRLGNLSAVDAVTTYAGVDVQGSGTIGDGLPRTDPNVHFLGANGVAVGPDGAVVVADGGNKRVRRIAPGAAGIVSTVAGNAPVMGSGLGANPLALVMGSPTRLAYDSSGAMYIADAAARRVWKVAPNGTTSLFAGNGRTVDYFTPQTEGPATGVPIGMPIAVAVAPDNSVYIATNGDSAGLLAYDIVKVSPTGNLTRVIGQGTAVFAPAPDGAEARTSGTGYVGDVAVDAGGTLYFAEFANFKIRKIGADGILRTYANLEPSGGSFGAPLAIEFDASGNLFAATGSQVVRIDGRTNQVQPVAGATSGNTIVPAAGFGGRAIDATFSSLKGVAVSADGDLFIADNSNVMKVTPTLSAGGAIAYQNGILSRLAGESGTTYDAGGLGANTRANPIDVAVNPVTNAVVYAESIFGTFYVGSRQIREVASNGCASLRLSTSAGSVLATGNGTALDDIPVSQLPRGGGIYALAKLRSTNLAQSATQASPLSAIPLSAIPLSAIPLSAIPLSAIPLSAIGGWAALLVGTPYEGLPLQNVTLGQVKDFANVGNVQLGQLDLRNSPLSAISIAGIALGRAPLSAIPLSAIDTRSPLEQWCAALATAGFDCALNGVDNATTMIDLELKAAPLSAIPLSAIPLSAIPLSAIPLSAIPLSAIPLSAIPLSAIPLSAIKITGTPLSAIPLSAIPLSAIDIAVDCAALGGCAGKTFQDAVNAGAIRPGARLGDIADALDTLNVGQLAPSLPATVTLEDILIGLVSRADLPWEAASLEQIGLTTSGTLGGSVATYRAGFRLYPDRPAGAVPVTVTMPAGFTYRPGTGVLNVQQVGAALTSTPIEPAIAGQTLTFQVPAGTPSPADATIEMSLRTGTDSGTSTVNATVGPVTANAPVANASVTISVTDPNEPNDITPTPIAKDRLYIGSIGTQTDRDLFTLPVPPRGTVTEIFLSHLPIDADLVVYDSTGEVSLRSGALRPAQTGPTVAIVDPVAGSAQQDVEPQTLQDVPIDPARPLADASARRGTTTETAKLVSRGQGGSYTLQVTGYNGAASGAPFLLRVRQTLPPGAGACPARTFAFAGQGVPGTATTIGSNTVRTLFLVNQKRLGDTYGPASAANVVTQLNTLAARPEVSGSVLTVDANSNVASAYAAWDSQPCDTSAPNNVVSAINAMVDNIPAAQRAALENIVIVGSDDIMPFARLNDDTSYSNELEYAADVANGSVATPLSAAMTDRKTLSDDPYGSFTPTTLSDGKVLYLPDVALGRLVETPAEIIGQITEYVNFNGRLNASTALTTGYDFLRDGATGVDAALGLRTGALGGARTTLINDTWNRAAIVAALFPTTGSPQIASLNAHFDHYGALPAVGDAAAGRADLLTTSDLTANANKLVGRLVFTMGCHSGLSVPDTYFGASSDRTLDWAQGFARERAIYIANTGYGYGDTDVVALSEKLNVELAKRLDGTMTAGQALRFAKHAYAADGLTTVYDLKALHQFVYYGLPMFGVGPIAVTPPAPPAPLATATDPATGIIAANVTVNPAFTTVPASNGSSYLIADGKSPIVADGRPIQPRTDIDVTQRAAGLVPHGALITAISSQDTSPFAVAISRPVVDLAANEPDIAANDAGFPATLTNIANFDAPDGERQRLSLAVGQWFADSNPANATNIGTQRRFTSLSARVFYREVSDTDFVPPSITRVTGTNSGGTVTFQVEATDAQLATVLYRDGATWRSITLTGTGPTRTGSGPTSVRVIEYIVQVVDASGNVAVSSNKAALHVIAPEPPPNGRQKVVPSVCVKKETDKKIVYRFGYENPNAFQVRIERGNDNRLIGANTGLQREFRPGVERKAFEVKPKNDAETVTWVLDGLQATGTRSTSPCADTSHGTGNSSGDDDDEKSEKERDKEREKNKGK